MKNIFARGSLNSCSSELVCIERKGTSEILKHSGVFTRISSELVTAVPIRGGNRVRRRVEENNFLLQKEVTYRGVLSSSVLYLSGFQEFNILILLMRTVAASVACVVLGARLVLALEEVGAGALCHQVLEGRARGVSVPLVWQSCSLPCQQLFWVQ